MMRRLLVLATVAVALCPLAIGKERRELSAPEQAQLEQDKLILTTGNYRQIFTPYIFTDGPVFITTDSVLNAWHVLFEESVKGLEDRFSMKIADALDQSLAHIDKEAGDRNPPQNPRPAVRRARIVLGTAARLAGGKWKGNPEVEAVITAEVKRIEDAPEGLYLPEWLKAEGSPVVGIDYAVFRPVGFYTRNERMQRYFRAVKWLQTAPFDLKRDDNIKAVVLICEAVEESWTLMEIARTYAKLVGPGDEADPQEIFGIGSFPQTGDLEAWRERAVTQREKERAYETGETPQGSFVVLAGRALVDLDLFRSTASPQRPFPDTLEIGVLLGSSLAEEMLKTQPELVAKVAKARADFPKRQGAYADYLRCVADLFAAPEPGSPEFMESPAWQRKSLNSALAGWAQIRHTWALQAKEDASSFGMVDGKPVGFVEPNPKFFQHLAQLSSGCVKLFDAEDAFSVLPSDISLKAAELLPAIRELNRVRKEAGEENPAADEAVYEGLRTLGGDLRFFWPFSLAQTDPHEMERKLQKIADGASLEEVFPWRSRFRPTSLRDRWRSLIDLTRDLESIAHRQLRGIDLSEEDSRFIKGYGETLASVMLYDGNSWLNPKDDAPRVTAVFNQPGQGFLMAGIGRPREIRVLYPWKGKEIECKGAVMPFLEMKSSSHLSDIEWRTLLNGPARPAAPEWIKPLMAEPAAK